MSVLDNIEDAVVSEAIKNEKDKAISKDSMVKAIVAAKMKVLSAEEAVLVEKLEAIHKEFTEQLPSGRGDGHALRHGQMRYGRSSGGCASHRPDAPFHRHRQLPSASRAGCPAPHT